VRASFQKGKLPKQFLDVREMSSHNNQVVFFDENGLGHYYVKGYTMIVKEYCSNGDLLTYIDKSKNEVEPSVEYRDSKKYVGPVF
jgi:hypothetical protein